MLIINPVDGVAGSHTFDQVLVTTRAIEIMLYLSDQLFKDLLVRYTSLFAHLPQAPVSIVIVSDKAITA
ncbi:hypothetical protein ACLCDV_11290 [Sphingobacterium sp. Lzh-3]|uniref:hypothetical protein n=1 Tax=Sphingobacterium sp. Lzh-3 TaxID=3382150 RepID=UPI00398CC1EE